MSALQSSSHPFTFANSPTNLRLYSSGKNVCFFLLFQLIKFTTLIDFMQTLHQLQLIQSNGMNGNVNHLDGKHYS